jgi:phage gp36-like protein
MIEIKQPGDTLILAHDFAPLTGNQVLSLGAIVVEPRGWAAGPALVVADSQIEQAQVRVKVSGGTAGEAYLIRITVLAEGAPVLGEIECHVLSLGFVLPDGAQAYCSPRDYVRRFGYEETLRFTDERGLGRIDGDKMGAALGDAMALVNGYIGGRYAAPQLPPIPPLIATYTATLARGLLAIHESDEHAAKRGMTMTLKLLGEVRDGKMLLTGAQTADAVQPASVQQNDVQMSAGARILSDTSLKGF